MITIPKSEQERFEAILYGQAQNFGLTSEEYLRKVWYHEQATKLGEYVAMSLLEELLSLVPITQADEKEMAVA
ncbi:hypothetical protein ES703_43511 [subsurface metagenome]